MTGPRLVLRSCAVCGGHWSGYPTGDDAPWYCPAHLDQAVRPFRVGDIITPIHRGDPWRHYVALSIDGDTLTYRRLGQPDAPTLTASIHNFRKV
jgi:hypothetical protein